MPGKGAELLIDWEKMWVRPYDKRSVDPYTRTRVILMNGTEFENVWFSHQFSRNVQDNDLRRTLALIRRSEQQQQKTISHIKPGDETVLEHTIGYEQLAVDLTAHLAKRVTDCNVKNALDFALLEDFDHLYRYADLLDLHFHVKAENLVGRYTEIMPGRPTIAHHRHPYDSVRWPMTGPAPELFDVLAANVITAAEQQTMNYYMNTAAVYPEETGRRLYQEIGMIEEQHVTQYGSLLNPNMTWLENLLVHQYTEAWLYWSMLQTETDREIRCFWEACFGQELLHLRMAEELLQRYEGKEWQQVIPCGEFPQPLCLESNIEYVRDILGGTVNNTALREEYADVRTLPEDGDFAEYQRRVNEPACNVLSHSVIEEYIRKNGRDYRFETAPNPVPQLRDRTHDDICTGRQNVCQLQNA
ncbi:MAG: hypothetical protein Q4A66_00995 [Eubacteriales bacterium]|nr:hypothetical protein [Eubacteriales bacterium]